VDTPGFSKPRHQYGVGEFCADLVEAMDDGLEDVRVLPTACGGRELDVTEIRELAIWHRDGFRVRTPESTT
jgi:hypothetical protein